ELGHNYRLAEPLAALARANLARFGQLLHRRKEQAQLLASLLHDTFGIAPFPLPTGEEWNGYAPLLRLTLPAPRAFCVHLAQRGVPNSVGTFGLVPTDQRAPFTNRDHRPCPNAARFIDTTLAVVLTDHDSDERIREYAHTITREARQWPHTA